MADEAGRRRRRLGRLAAEEPNVENESVPVRMRFPLTLAAIAAASFAMGALEVPALGQSAPPHSATRSKPIPPPEARIDINHASADELLKVPGMTPSWAGRIVRFRPYRTKQDLLDRGVLPSDVYDRIKDYVIAHRDKE
jgi:DNA uptake protein ComE-like DNA-binding protein